MLDYKRFKENYLSWHPNDDDLEIQHHYHSYVDELVGKANK